MLFASYVPFSPHSSSSLHVSCAQVKSVDEMLGVLRAGQALRATASTHQNDVSSRSHTCFTISVVQYRDGCKPVTGACNIWLRVCVGWACANPQCRFSPSTGPGDVKAAAVLGTHAA